MTARARSAKARPLANSTPPSARSDDDFSTMECLGEARRGVALDAAEPQQRAERVFGEPALRALRPVGGQQEAGLAPCLRGSHGRVNIRLAQAAVVLRNLVFENRMVAKRVPGQLARDAMVLVQVAALVREDQVGHGQLLEALEVFLDRGVLARKVAVAKAAEQHALPARAGQE